MPQNTDPETQTIYDELNKRGIFKGDPEAQVIGHELRARGVVSDVSQGGLVAPQPPAAAKQPPIQVNVTVNGQGGAPPASQQPAPLAGGVTPAAPASPTAPQTPSQTQTFLNPAQQARFVMQDHPDVTPGAGVTGGGAPIVPHPAQVAPPTTRQVHAQPNGQPQIAPVGFAPNPLEHALHLQNQELDQIHAQYGGNVPNIPYSPIDMKKRAQAETVVQLQRQLPGMAQAVNQGWKSFAAEDARLKARAKSSLTPEGQAQLAQDIQDHNRNWQLLQNRTKQLQTYGQMYEGVKRQYGAQALHTGPYLPSEINVPKGGSFLGDLADNSMLGPTARFVGNLASKFVPGASLAERFREALPVARAAVMLKGDYPSLPANPGQNPTQRAQKDAETLAVRKFFFTDFPGVGLRPNGDVGTARWQQRVHQAMAGMTPWQQKLVPIFEQQVKGEREASDKAKLAQTGTSELVGLILGHGVAETIAGPATRWLSKFTAPLEERLIQSGINPFVKTIARAGLRVAPTAFASGAAGSVGMGAGAGAATLLQGGGLREAGVAGLRAMPEGFLIGAGLGGTHAALEARTAGPKAPPAAGGTTKIKGEPAPELPGPQLQIADGTTIDLRRTPRAKLEQILNFTPNTHPSWQALNDYLFQHDAHAAGNQTVAPVGSEGQLTEAWDNPKNAARKSVDAIRATAAQHPDPQVQQVLTDSATELEKHWSKEAVADLHPDHPQADQAAPPMVSGWRQLTPEQRAGLPKEVRTALLVQDLNNSVHVLDPSQPQFTAVPKGIKNLKGLESQADLQFNRAQEVASQRGAQAPPSAAPAAPLEPQFPAATKQFRDQAQAEATALRPEMTPEEAAAAAPNAAAQARQQLGGEPTTAQIIQAATEAHGTHSEAYRRNLQAFEDQGGAVPAEHGGPQPPALTEFGTTPEEQAKIDAAKGMAPPESAVPESAPPTPEEPSAPAGNGAAPAPRPKPKGPKGGAVLTAEKPPAVELPPVREETGAVETPPLAPEKAKGAPPVPVSGAGAAYEPKAGDLLEGKTTGTKIQLLQRFPEGHAQGGKWQATVVHAAPGAAVQVGQNIAIHPLQIRIGYTPVAGNNGPAPQGAAPSASTSTSPSTKPQERRQDEERTNVSPQGFVSQYMTARDAHYANLREEHIARYGSEPTPEFMGTVRGTVEGLTNPLRDPVTGLLNNHSLPATIERAAEHTKQTGEPASFYSLDVKNLGGLNAAVGHSGGDEALAEVAKIIRGAFLPLGAHQSHYRVGGDEIGGVVVGAAPERVAQALADVQRQVREYSDTHVHTGAQGKVALRSVQNPKQGKQHEFGTGVEFHVHPILPGQSAKEVLDTANDAVEQRKKEAVTAAGAASQPGAGMATGGRGEGYSTSREDIPHGYERTGSQTFRLPSAAKQFIQLAPKDGVFYHWYQDGPVKTRVDTYQPASEMPSPAPAKQQEAAPQAKERPVTEKPPVVSAPEVKETQEESAAHETSSTKSAAHGEANQEAPAQNRQHVEPKTSIAHETAPLSDEQADWTRLVVALNGKLNEAWKYRRPIFKDNPALMKFAAEQLGGTLTEGKFTTQDVYDALETAINKFMVEQPLAGKDPRSVVAKLRELLALLPTQTARTDEKVEFQQFSTPPTIAYTAAYVLNPRPGETVLEPSAGTGSLAVMAEALGGVPVVNEIAPRRQMALSSLGYQPTSADAERLNSTLPANIRATAILMNPPFSATGGRVSRHDNKYGMRHLEEALKRLEPGGRLVAIMGRGMSFDHATAAPFWAKIMARYHVRANISMPGAEYRKYGTSFDNQLIVIDHDGPTPGANGAERIGNVVTGRPETLEALLEVIDARGLRNRPAPVVAADQSGRVEGATAGHPGAGEHGPRTVAAERSGSAGGGQRGVRHGSAEPHGEPATGEAVPATESEPTTGSTASTGPENRGHGAPLRVSPDSGVATLLDRVITKDDLNVVRDWISGRSYHSYLKRKVTASPKVLHDYVEQSPNMPLSQEVRTLLKLDTIADTPENRAWRAAEAKKAAARAKVKGGKEPTLSAADQQAMTDAAAATTAPDPNSQPPSPNSHEVDTGVFVRYQAPEKIPGKPHPGHIVTTGAMAAVEKPPITEALTIPDAVLEGGAPSDIQVEAILRTWQRFGIIQKDGRRAGFLLGDGTGVGKGTENAGIAVEYRNRMKAAGKPVRILWLSATGDLKADAGRDLKSVGGGDIPLRLINEFDGALPIDMGDGIVFSSYSSLRTQSKATKKGPFAGKQRWEQLAEWMKAEPLIIWDESHKLKHAMEGKDGSASQTAIAGNNLDRGIPLAHVVYSSATGATEILNLAYMHRLGLWGMGTPFPGGVGEFMVEIGQGGVGALEMVSRDLVSTGSMLSRNLSYDGVEYDELSHTLTPDETEQYNAGAGAWRLVQAQFVAGAATTNLTKQKQMRLNNEFWSTHQRFFRMLITALKTPAMIARAKEALKQDKAVVIGLIGTNEMREKQQLAKAAAEEIPLDELDFSPREIIRNFVDKFFPIHNWTEVEDEEGNVSRQIALNPDGTEEVNPEALALKNEVLGQLANIYLPENPLDQIVQAFGPANVAEISGRKGRREQQNGKTVRVPRSNAQVMREKDEFQEGKRQVAVLTKKGDTGFSIQADLRAKNQKQRVFFLHELNWSADSEMQRLGRVHRTNQRVPPRYVLVSTNVGGEKRFSSTIARRLASLGAITRGSREAAAGSGDQIAKYNFETPQGETAVNALYYHLMSRQPVPGIADGREVLKQMGLLKVNAETGEEIMNPNAMGEVPKFLNRVLALDLHVQNAVFDQFMRLFEAAVANAKASGTFDDGVADVKAIHAKATAAAQEIPTGLPVGKTRYLPIEVETATRKWEWEDAERFLRFATPHRNAQGQELKAGFFKNEKSGELVIGYPIEPKDGKSRWGVRHVDMDKVDYLENQAFEAKFLPFGMADEGAKNLWQRQVGEMPATHTSTYHMLTGTLMPLWKRLRAMHGDRPLRVMRLTLDDGTRIVGVRLPSTRVQDILGGLNLAVTVTPEDIYDGIVTNNQTVSLDGGLRLARRMVMGGQAIEVLNVPNPTTARVLRDLGVTSQADYGGKPRFWIAPTSREAEVALLTKILDTYPVFDANYVPAGMQAGFIRLFASTKDRNNPNPVQYHGSSSPVTLGSVWERRQDQNLYGPGFYTTDNLEIARSYTKKGKGTVPSLYEVQWRAKTPPRLIDLEKPLPRDTYPIFEQAIGDAVPLDFRKTGKEIYADFKSILVSEGADRDEAQEMMSDLADFLHEKGYDGFTHRGGRKEGAIQHQVVIYFHPLHPLTGDPSLTLKPVLPPGMRPGFIRIPGFGRGAAGGGKGGGKGPNQPPDFGMDPEDWDWFRRNRGASREKVVKQQEGFWRRLWNEFTRDFRHLPRNAEYAKIRRLLTQLLNGRKIASNRSVIALREILGGLSNAEYDLFNWVVLTRDLNEEIARQRSRWETAHPSLDPADFRPEIPGPWDEAGAAKKLLGLETELPKYPKVEKALQTRRQVATAVVNEYADAFEAAMGKRPEFDRTDYFRHLVLDFITRKEGGGGTTYAPIYADYLKERKGSTRDIETGFVEAELNIYNRLTYDAMKFRVFAAMKTFDITNTLKTAAIEANDATVMELFEHMADEHNQRVLQQGGKLVSPEDLYKRALNWQQAAGFDNLGRMASRGVLPDDNGRFVNLIAEIAQNWKDNQLRVAGGHGPIPMEPAFSKQLFEYAAWLLKEQGGKPGSGAAGLIFKGIRQKAAALKGMLGREFVTAADIAQAQYPNYVEFKPIEGHLMYRAFTVEEQLAREINDQMGQPVEVTKGDLRQVRAVGKERPGIWLPRELASTLNELFETDRPSAALGEMAQKAMRGWKLWTLFNPLHNAAYELRNTSADFDAMFVGNPQGFLHLPNAVKEMAGFYLSKNATPELKDWIARGGLEGRLQNAEGIGSTRGLDLIGKYMAKQPGALEKAKGFAKFWALAPNDFRDGAIRYANYRSFLAQIEGHPSGRPKSWGASLPREILALDNPKDQAYALANELVGPYDQVSHAGRWLRQNLMPFWSFPEINARRWYRLATNAVRNPRDAAGFANKATGGLKLGAYGAYRLASFGAKALALTAALDWYNHRYHPDAEKFAPDYIRGRPHLIVTNPLSGRPAYIGNLGAGQEVTSWLGLDNFLGYREKVLNGHMTVKEALTDAAKQFPTRVYGQLGPIKSLFETIGGTTTYPDPFNPRPIKDRAEAFAKEFNLGDTYRQLMGLPERRTPIGGHQVPSGYLKALFTTTEYDPGDAAYQELREDVHHWLNERGIEQAGAGGGDTQKSLAMYHVKMALRFGDQAAADRFLVEYGKQGGDDRGYQQSLHSLDPVGHLTKNQLHDFVGSLHAPDDQARLRRALWQYQTMAAPGLAPESMKALTAEPDLLTFTRMMSRAVGHAIDRSQPFQHGLKANPEVMAAAAKLKVAKR